MILEEETFAKTGKIFQTSTKKHKITCKCDYCGIIFERNKSEITKSRKNSAKDNCTNNNCINEKKKEVSLAKCGATHPMKTEKGRENFRLGCEKSMGVGHPMQLEATKEKVKQTHRDRRGKSHHMKTEAGKQKYINTCETKYNVHNTLCLDWVQEKRIQTLEENYNVDNSFKSPIVKEKVKITCEKIYGVYPASKAESVKVLSRNECLRKYGKFPVNNYGETQKALQDWLNSLGFNFKTNNELVQGREIDLYEPAKKLAIEYCGLHWHNELSPEPRDKNYHYYKYQSCLSQGVQLLTIFSDEWKTRNEQCRGHIKSLLGISQEKVFARNCTISEITSEIGKDFFDKYHIQGKNSLGVVFFGLFYHDELYGVMSLGRHNRQVKTIVLDRLCFKSDVQVLGGASKLFSRCVDWAKKNNHKKIISFSDNRWSLGKVYEAMNFKLDLDSKPDYSYVKVQSPSERLSKQSQKKKAVDCPEGMTELEWATQRGLARIWDCGKKRWLFSL